MIPNDFKERLKTTLPIHEVASALGISLERMGNSYVGYCPFHDDTSPSMMLNAITNTFSCMACGAGSLSHATVKYPDNIGLVMSYKQCGFVEAIQWLGYQFGIDVPFNNNPENLMKVKKEEWWRERSAIMKDSYRVNLETQKDAILYLTNRGFDPMVQAMFDVGFGSDEFKDFLNTKGKITFPVYDYNGQIVSFVGRVPLEKENLAELNSIEKERNLRITPKYDYQWNLSEKNTPKDIYDMHPHHSFKRNLNLYGINYAKDAIRKTGKAYIVEGFTDVWRLFSHGIYNAVSSMGVTLSEEQLNLLMKAGAKTIVLMRDGDDAGIQAMKRDASSVLAKGFMLEICPMPIGHDPDSLGRTMNLISDEYARWIYKNTRRFSDWKVEVVYKQNIDDIMFYYKEINNIQEDRILKVANAIASTDDEVERELQIRQYADLLNISKSSLKHYVLQYISTNH